MRKSVPKMGRLLVPAALSCLPLQLLLAHSRAGPVTGRIVDDKEVGLPGVNVLVKGSSNGTQTNTAGRYTIEAPTGATLVFSYIGYASQKAVVGDRTTIDVALGPDSKSLGHVVVVGFLAQDRQNVSSAVGSLNVKEATRQPVPTIITRCRRWRAASRWS